jgi:nucleoside-diphosphate-sugar epimerase
MKVLVTGGSGKVGLAAIDALLEAGHEAINADRMRPANPRGSARSKAARYVETDLSDVGQVAGIAKGCDAILHLGAIPNPYGHADEVVFANNVLGTYAVLQAAMLVGISKVTMASSLSALGTAWSVDAWSPLYAPVDEEHPLLVKDAYGLSKEVDERTAEMFHRRTGMQVVCLRFHWVAYYDEAQERAAGLAVNPNEGEWMRHLWGYVDSRDAASLCVATLEADGLGFDVFQCTAADSLANRPTEEMIREYAPDTEIRSAIPGTSTAYSTAKVSRVLGWQPKYSWRDRQ